MENQNPESLTEIDPEYRRLHTEHRDHEHRTSQRHSVWKIFVPLA